MYKKIAFIALIMFVLIYNLATYLNRMNYCEQKIKEIESGQIINPSYVFDKKILKL